MNLRLAILVATLALAAAAGCYTGSAVDTNTPYPTVSTDGTQPSNEEPTGDDDDGKVTPVATAKGLPCDVAVLIKSACGSCHGAKPDNGAANTIASYDDLVAPSGFDPSKTVAELALQRMKSIASPMPPSGNLGKNEISILSDWIAGGMKKGTCAPPPKAAKADGGVSTPLSHDDDAGVDADAPPAPPATSCTSGVTAEPGAGSTMKPGNTCLGCHEANGGPAFPAAGTVYPSLFEPNDCNGSAGTMDGLKVLLIDAKGGMKALPVNAAGNFMAPATADLPKPYRAIVVRGNQIREMKGLQSNGDCNACHTERGKNGAPGRVMAP